MMNVLKRVLTWWNGQTLNTQVWTSLYGEKVGEDGQGNVFYQSGGGKRRWVIYQGESEASRVDPDWHGWLHHTYDQPPTTQPMTRRAWQKPHVMNKTGTSDAYIPPGSILNARPAPRDDYEAWQPE